jgi:hypothetical protein
LSDLSAASFASHDPVSSDPARSDSLKPDSLKSEPARSDLPAPPASRLPRARWVDPRLLAGVLLVLVSVVLGSRIIAEADTRTPVWSVTRDLGAGTTLADRDVRMRSVRLDEAAARYVSAAQGAEGLVLSRPLDEGELLPVGAIAAQGVGIERREVVIQVDQFAAAGLAKGSVVDVYAVPETDAGEVPASPELVLAGVTVAAAHDNGGRFGASGTKSGLTLLVDRPLVPELIDAVAHGDVYVVRDAGDTPVEGER